MIEIKRLPLEANPVSLQPGFGYTLRGHRSEAGAKLPRASAVGGTERTTVEVPPEEGNTQGAWTLLAMKAFGP